MQKLSLLDIFLFLQKNKIIFRLKKESNCLLKKMTIAKSKSQSRPKAFAKSTPLATTLNLHGWPLEKTIVLVRSVILLNDKDNWRLVAQKVNKNESYPCFGFLNLFRPKIYSKDVRLSDFNSHID